MAEYHVGCGMFGIYAGTVKANGKEWKDKTCVTDEAVEAVRDWLVSKAEEEKQGFYGYAWDTKDGKTVILKVTIKNFAIFQGIVIAFIAITTVSSIVLSIFMYRGLFSADIPEWMKWAFVFLGR